MTRPLLIAVAVVWAGVAGCGRYERAGIASVIDGDTIELHGQRIRLWGVDAPEHDQTCQDAAGAAYRCGQRAANELAAWLGQRTVICEPRGKSYERVVATCRVGGEDVGAWLVANGWAWDYERYSAGTYADEEAAARAAHLGIWQGDAQPAWLWRKHGN